MQLLIIAINKLSILCSLISFINNCHQASWNAIIGLEDVFWTSCLTGVDNSLLHHHHLWVLLPLLANMTQCVYIARNILITTFRSCIIDIVDTHRLPCHERTPYSGLSEILLTFSLSHTASMKTRLGLRGWTSSHRKRHPRPISLVSSK